MEKKRILLFFDLYSPSHLWFFYSKRKKIILVIDCIFFFYLTMSFLRAIMLQSITKHSTWERRRLSFGDTGFNFGVELTWMKLLLHNFTKMVTNLYFPYSVSWHDKDVNWYSYCFWKVPYYFFEFLSEKFQFSVESVTFFYSLLCTEKGWEFCFLKYILLDIS